MIQIYDSQNTDFEHNGDETLFPEECTVSAELNGTWVLNMTHPIDDEGRWKYIEEEAVIAVPTFMGKKQLFRIDRVSTVDQDDSEITAVAYPIFWDSGDDQFLTDSRPTNKNGQEALNIMLAGSKYSAESNITRTSTAYFERRNMMDALNGEDSPTFIQRWGGEILYDNYKVIVNERVGGDYGAEVRYRKNMDGIQCEISMENVVTRIVPVAYNGYTIGGNSGYVDSSNIDKYAKVYTKEIRFEDVKMEEDAQEDDEENGVIICRNQTEMDRALIQRCNEQYEEGIDLPVVTMTVGVVDLEGTEEYKDFEDLVEISLGDTAHCYNTKLDITTEARCIGIIWDCIKNCVDSVTLGDYQITFVKQMVSTIERISSAFRDDGTMMASKISGVLDAMQTQLRYQQNTAKHMAVRAVLFEDLNKESPLYGAMAMGTQGLEISKIRTADGRDWDWTTAMTAEGIVASTIVTGILSDKTGSNYWDLDKGIVHMNVESFTLSGKKVTDIAQEKVDDFTTGDYTDDKKNFQNNIEQKSRNFISQPVPPYKAGDTWTQGTYGDFMYCVKSRETGSFDSNDWERGTGYTDDTKALEALAAIQKVRTVNINLSNEYQVIQADEDGTIENFPEVKTTVSVYFGTQDVSNKVSYTVTASEGIVGSWDSDKNMYTVTAMNTDEGYVDFNVLYNSTGEKYTATRRFTVTKIRQGESGCYYNLVSQTDALVWSADKGYYEPLNPTMTAYKQIGEDKREEYAGDWKIEATKDGATWIQMQLRKSASMVTITTKNILVTNGPQMLRVTLYRKGTEEILAQKTIQFLVPMRTQQDVFNMLTNNGAVQGIFLRDGKLYINAEYMVTGTIADKTGKSYWNLENGEMQLTGIFQQYTKDGIKSIDIQNNEIRLYAWDDNGNYVGSIGAIKSKSGRVGVDVWCDTGDLLSIGYYNKDENSEYPIHPVIQIDSNTAKKEVPWIKNTASGTIFPDNPSGGVTVQNGLITKWNLKGINGDVNMGNGLIFTYKNGLVVTTRYA